MRGMLIVPGMVTTQVPVWGIDKQWEQWE